MVGNNTVYTRKGGREKRRISANWVGSAILWSAVWFNCKLVQASLTFNAMYPSYGASYIVYLAQSCTVQLGVEAQGGKCLPFTMLFH